MKQRNYRIGPGAASLLLVVVIVSMSVLGLLALISARNDYKLTQRAAEFTVAEYTASAQAERTLALLDGILLSSREDTQDDEEYLRVLAEVLPEGLTLSGRIVSWEESSDSGRTLMCAVEMLPLTEKKRFSWKTHAFVSVADETGDDVH